MTAAPPPPSTPDEHREFAHHLAEAGDRYLARTKGKDEYRLALAGIASYAQAQWHLQLANEPQHEVMCPAPGCGTTIRARMADAPQRPTVEILGGIDLPAAMWLARTSGGDQLTVDQHRQVEQVLLSEVERLEAALRDAQRLPSAPQRPAGSPAYQPPRTLTTPCHACGHTYNWHTSAPPYCRPGCRCPGFIDPAGTRP